MQGVKTVRTVRQALFAILAIFVNREDKKMPEERVGLNISIDRSQRLISRDPESDPIILIIAKTWKSQEELAKLVREKGGFLVSTIGLILGETKPDGVIADITLLSQEELRVIQENNIPLFVVFDAEDAEAEKATMNLSPNFASMPLGPLGKQCLANWLGVGNLAGLFQGR